MLKSLYYSLFNSHLSYGLSTWGINASEYLINSLQILQNKVLRLIASISQDSFVHCADIRKTFGILTVKDQIKVQITSIMWDYDHDTLPPHLNSFFIRSSEVHHHNTRGASCGKLFFKPINSTSYGLKSLKFKGAKIINDFLGTDIYRNAKTKKAFLKNSKLDLVSLY